MEQVNYSIRLDMRDTGEVDTGIRIKQGDSNIMLLFKIMYGGEQYFDADTTPQVVFKRPDGTVVYANTSAGDGIYACLLLGQEMAVPGRVVCDVKFTDGAGRTSTASCIIESVPDTMGDNAAETGLYYNDLERVVNQLQGIKQYIDNVGDFQDLIENINDAVDTIESVRGDIADNARDIADNARDIATLNQDAVKSSDVADSIASAIAGGTNVVPSGAVISELHDYDIKFRTIQVTTGQYGSVSIANYFDKNTSVILSCITDHVVSGSGVKIDLCVYNGEYNITATRMATTTTVTNTKINLYISYVTKVVSVS